MDVESTRQSAGFQDSHHSLPNTDGVSIFDIATSDMDATEANLARGPLIFIYLFYLFI